MTHFGGKYKVVIEDLDQDEAIAISQRIRELTDDGEIDFTIQDCISVQNLDGKVLEESE